MGRNSGSVNPGNGNGISQARRGTTEQGYTAKMVKNIVGMEQRYRNNKDETLHAFSSSGDIVISFAGKGEQVTFDWDKIPANSILTHNHPRAIGQTGIRAIGNSFSVQDIASAVSVNAKEMRAVTPTYTFSVKRPKGGWGGSAKEIVADYNKAHQQVYKEMNNYLGKQGYSEASIARAESTHFHKVMQKMSKKYGWDYTKKRG